METELRRGVNAASVGELAWLDSSGLPDLLPVTPLVFRERPAVAYPYAFHELAVRIAASPCVALVMSDPRMTGSRWQAAALTGRPSLVEDPEGELVKAELMTQELRKYPPSRTLADSILLRKENWWYLPRAIISIDVSGYRPLVPRTGGGQQVLAVHTADGLHIDTVEVSGIGGDELSLTSLTGSDLPDGRAAIMGHDFSEPDLERWTPWVTRGDLTGGRLAPVERPQRTTLEPTLKLRQRYRRHRELEKGCRDALRSLV